MLTVIFGLSTALVFGTSDFMGGIASKRMGAMLTTALSGATGVLPMLIVMMLMPSKWIPELWIWGLITGVAGACAIMLIYASLAIGPMSILSPLGALVGAIVPVVWALVLGENLPVLGYVALGVALVAILLVSMVSEKSSRRPSLRGILVAAAGGIFIGIYMITLDQVPADTGVNVLIVERAIASGIMFAGFAVTVLLRRAQRRGMFGPSGTPRADMAVGDGGRLDYRSGIAIAAIAGVVDGVANLLLIFGMFSGDLSVMAVLTALYPAGTILLAAVVLKERVGPIQITGMVLALTASAMLALS